MRFARERARRAPKKELSRWGHRSCYPAMHKVSRCKYDPPPMHIQSLYSIYQDQWVSARDKHLGMTVGISKWGQAGPEYQPPGKSNIFAPTADNESRLMQTTLPGHLNPSRIPHARRSGEATGGRESTQHAYSRNRFTARHPSLRFAAMECYELPHGRRLAPDTTGGSRLQGENWSKGPQLSNSKKKELPAWL